MSGIRFGVVLLGSLALWATACSEEGPAEKAGRQLDEAVEKFRDAGDGPLERLGEDLDEALEAAGDAIDEAVEDARKAAKDARR